MRKVAIIPARGGSKGVSRKNTRKVAGKELIAWTIEAALPVFGEDVVVTTDCDVAADTARKLGCKIIDRPSFLATDEALMSDVVSHVIDTMQLERNDLFCLLQPTSPIRTDVHIREALKKFLSVDGGDALISVKKADKGSLKHFILESEQLKPLAGEAFPFMPRQALPNVYVSNGAIYIGTVWTFVRYGFLGTACVAYEMDEQSSIDIDTEADLALANTILEQVKSQ